MTKCYYCGAPATSGYPDLPSSQTCDACHLVRLLHQSVWDIRDSVRSATEPEAVRRALAHEKAGAGRTTVLKILRGRLRQLEREHAAAAIPQTPNQP